MWPWCNLRLSTVTVGAAVAAGMSLYRVCPLRVSRAFPNLSLLPRQKSVTGPLLVREALFQKAGVSCGPGQSRGTRSLCQQSGQHRGRESGDSPVIIEKQNRKEPSTVMTAIVTAAHYFFRFVWSHNDFNWKILTQLCFIFELFRVLRRSEGRENRTRLHRRGKVIPA